MTSIKTTLKFISLFIVMIMITTLISACASLIEPKHITIEYDEEVKLHDGEMIWVHITRHYLEGGKEISEMFRGGGKNVIPTYVEISWDTGFEGIGRKSVFFDALVTIDKYEGTWYVGGAKNNSLREKNGSVSCDNYGLFVEGYKCIIAINKNGFVKLEENKKELAKLKRNIFYPSSVSSSRLSREDLKDSKLDWDKKISLQNYLLKNYADIPLNRNWIN